MEDSSDSNGEGNGESHSKREYASNTNYKRQVYLEFSEFSPAQIKKIEDIFNQYVHPKPQFFFFYTVCGAEAFYKV